MRLQLGVLFKAVQQLGVRIDITDERLHKYLLLAVSFVGKAACTQLAADWTQNKSFFRADCRLIRAHCNSIRVHHSLREGLSLQVESETLQLVLLLVSHESRKCYYTSWHRLITMLCQLVPQVWFCQRWCCRAHLLQEDFAAIVLGTYHV